MMKHPNAAVAAGGSSLSVFVVWLFTNVLHWPLSAEDGAAIAGAVAALALFVGRNGLRGVWRRIVDGTGSDSGAIDVIEAAILAILALVIALVVKVF